jgi:hypothetical protein
VVKIPSNIDLDKLNFILFFVPTFWFQVSVFRCQEKEAQEPKPETGLNPKPNIRKKNKNAI